MNMLKQISEYKNAFMNNPVAPYVVGALLIAGGLALLITCSDSKAGVVSGGIFLGTGSVLMIALRGYKHYKASQFQDPVLARQNERPQVLQWEGLPGGMQITIKQMKTLAQEKDLGELTTQKDGKTINIADLDETLTVEELLNQGYQISGGFAFAYRQHTYREDGDL